MGVEGEAAGGRAAPVPGHGAPAPRVGGSARGGGASVPGSGFPVLRLERVTVRLGGAAVLEDVSLTVPRGSFLGIVGPNGGGKTTLLRTVLGLVRHARGRILLFGEDLATFHRWERVGYVPQRTAVARGFPTTVEELVLTGRLARLPLFRRPGAADRDAVARALRDTGIWDLRRRAVGRLSGGQQQRAFLARALAGDPELLLLDEPTTGVDPGARAAFFALLHRLQRERGLTLVMVSHDVGAVAREVTALACLNRRLVYHGEPAGVETAGVLESLYGMPVRLVSHDH